MNHVAMTAFLYLLFFLSGISGLIYQVVWVRMFGNVFGNTIHSASLVVAIFMLGLGAGSFIVGAWADRRYAARPESLLRAYGGFELVIGAAGLAIAATLPRLGELSALMSSYSQESSGWYALSTMSYLGRAAIALALLMPITLLMGGTLTLLIRHLVRSDLQSAGWRIAVLYAVNTAGAALGALLTDFSLVPATGLWGTQMVAVALNGVAGLGALRLARKATLRGAELRGARVRGARVRRSAPSDHDTAQSHDRTVAPSHRAVLFTVIGLALTGFAGMGMEILWFRHFTILLGGFRAVFSLLLAVILIGIGLGSLAGGYLHRRTGRALEWLLVVQGCFVAATLLGFAIADVGAIDRAAAATERAAGSGLVATFAELWFNARPMLVEAAIPALLMGFSFPLANAIIQRSELTVGRRAGVLYLANTAGAVCGSLAAGFLLLPALGLQTSATILMVVGVLALVPLYVSGRARSALTRLPDAVGAERARPVAGRPVRAFAMSSLIAAIALGAWVTLPSAFVITRALGLPKGGERLLTISDGLTEIIAVTERSGQGRTLVTNGHAMSSTLPLSQRYMRALAHIPLLSMEKPETVLVIGFGVGNTTQAATLHPSVRRVDLADLSRGILAHATYFSDANKGVLRDPRLAVYINDGRQHLQMQPPASYDLITLEPPPIGYAGVGALYSREFYALARTRLRERGYLSQWIPAYQVRPETTLAMVRAFIDVFPQAVLLSGAESDLLLLGANDATIEIDPVRIGAALARAPAVRADLDRLDLGDIHEIIGTFVGSAQTLMKATRDVVPVTDDRPMQEYSVRSMLNFGRGVPSGIVDIRGVAAWCPRCFMDGRPVPAVGPLETYFALLDLAYGASRDEIAQARILGEKQGRTIAGSTYLGMIVPESAELHNVLGIDLATRGQFDAAIAEFRIALQLDPDAARTHWHLGAALASRGDQADAVTHLRRSVDLEPGNSQAHNDLGLLLARTGHLDEAVDQFQRALALDPQSEDARRYLAALSQKRGN
jgi:spermidine synthase